MKKVQEKWTNLTKKKLKYVYCVFDWSTIRSWEELYQKPMQKLFDLAKFQSKPSKVSKMIFIRHIIHINGIVVVLENNYLPWTYLILNGEPEKKPKPLHQSKDKKEGPHAESTALMLIAKTIDNNSLATCWCLINQIWNWPDLSEPDTPSTKKAQTLSPQPLFCYLKQ